MSFDGLYTLAPAGATPGAFQYLEWKESEQENFIPESAECIRTFLVRWEERATFIDLLLGYSLNTGAGIHRELPEQHPIYPLLFANEARIEGQGLLGKETNSTPKYKLAKVIVTYRYLDYEVAVDGVPELHRFVTRNYTYSSEFLTVDGNYRFATGNLPLKAAPGKLVSTVEKALIWHDVPPAHGDVYNVPNYLAIKSCIGKVNSVAFDGDRVGTVLFLGVDPHRTKPKVADRFGLMWDVTMKFLIKDNGTDVALNPIGHNWLWNPFNSQWDLVTSNGGTIYQYADFNVLFTIP